MKTCMFAFLVIPFLFIGCSHNKSEVDGLPVIDISQKYSMEKRTSEKLPMWNIFRWKRSVNLYLL